MYIPKHSMYAIYAYIGVVWGVNVGIYDIYIYIYIPNVQTFTGKWINQRHDPTSPRKNQVGQREECRFYTSVSDIHPYTVYTHLIRLISGHSHHMKRPHRWLSLPVPHCMCSHPQLATQGSVRGFCATRRCDGASSLKCRSSSRFRYQAT